ncbi:MAG: hypothetical protein OXI86_03925, partial [Candidatus Poribacteria bacterium]|nr:hypothetical protein [Candidatus Poribacteria bacterium]
VPANLQHVSFLTCLESGEYIMIECRCQSAPSDTSITLIASVLVLTLAAMTIQQDAQPQIAFVSARDGDINIYVMDEDGKNVVQLTDHPQVDATPAWSPDGRRIAFSSLRDEPPNTHGNSEIYIMDADGGNPTRLTQEPNSVDTHPSWSPYGNQITFASNRHGTGDIHVMNDDGGNLRRITLDDTNRSPYDWAPAWSPDGRFIAFESSRGGRGSGLWLMSPDGTNPVKLVNPPGHDTTPTWSPDGKQIAFASRDGKNGTWEIYRTGADGGGLKKLTTNLANDQWPAWSPSGEQIAFNSDRDGDHDIYTMNPDGEEIVKITDHAADDFAPSWFPSALAVSEREKLPTQWAIIKSKR